MPDKGPRAAARRVHFAALGYQPMRMKPVHFATNFFLTLSPQTYRLELLNKTVVVKPKGSNQKDEYVTENLRPLLIQNGVLAETVSEHDFAALRRQLSGVLDNDGSAVYATYAPYKPFSSDYTLSSQRLLTAYSKNHGYSGSFLNRVLKTTQPGRDVLRAAKTFLEAGVLPAEKLLEPLMEKLEEADEWQDDYDIQFGQLSSERLRYLAAMMAPQTKALAQLVVNLKTESAPSSLRHLVIGLCSWLLIYLHKVHKDGEIPALFMDLLQGQNRRVRALSCYIYARERDRFYQSYYQLRKKKKLTVSKKDFSALEDLGFKILEQHYSDLAVRIGFVQPRAHQGRKKHFELQPDTLRTLVMSVLSSTAVVPLEKLCSALRETWGVVAGGCPDDQEYLAARGLKGINEDEDLEVNRDALKQLLMRLGMAVEPSDGLVLCGIDEEALL